MTVFVIFWLAIITAVFFLLAVAARVIVSALDAVLAVGGILIIAMVGSLIGSGVIVLFVSFAGILFGQGIVAFIIEIGILLVILDLGGIYILGIAGFFLEKVFSIFEEVVEYIEYVFESLGNFFEEKYQQLLGLIVAKVDNI